MEARILQHLLQAAPTALTTKRLVSLIRDCHKKEVNSILYHRQQPSGPFVRHGSPTGGAPTWSCTGSDTAPTEAPDTTPKSSSASTPDTFTPAPASKQMSRLALADELMQEHGLVADGWTLGIDSGRRRAGCTRFSDKVISFSRYYIATASDEDMRDTILHEIAHALVPPTRGANGQRDSHGPQWRRKAISIGCTGRRCLQQLFTRGGVKIACVNGCGESYRHTRPSRPHLLRCRYCRGTVKVSYGRMQVIDGT